MRSVLDVVDEYFVMYSPIANHGVYNPLLVCPESRDDLVESAFSVAPDSTRWFEYGAWRGEGEQFKAAWQHTDAEIILKLDADEIWMPGLLEDAIAHGVQERAREIRVPLRHYWRSFYKAFTQDPAAPGRIYVREFDRRETTYAPADERNRIQHFGYAQNLNLMRYKMATHGHSPEFTNRNWFEEVYAANRQYDCHPIGSDAWMVPDDVVPPAFLMSHPYAKLSVIE